MGYNSHILGAFIGLGGLRNFVNTTRPLFNKKLGWDITVIYLGHLLGWGIGKFCIYKTFILSIARLGYNSHIFGGI